MRRKHDCHFAFHGRVLCSDLVNPTLQYNAMLHVMQTLSDLLGLVTNLRKPLRAVEDTRDWHTTNAILRMHYRGPTTIRGTKRDHETAGTTTESTSGNW